MTCGYCKSSNTEEDHRCRHCGRRLTGTVVAAPRHLAEEHVRLAVQVLGANALAAARNAEPRRSPLPTSVAGTRQTRDIPIDTGATLDSLPRKSLTQAAQTSLFASELQAKIIEFGLPGKAAASAPAVAPEPAPAQVPRRAAVPAVSKQPEAAKRRTHAVDDSQATLDFLPPLKNVPRTLKTNAEAVIFCDAAVAAPIHRATAAALDASMILMGFGGFLLLFQTVARPAHFDSVSLILLGAMLGLTALVYGLLFAISGTVTPGMRWTKLRLVNFDGFPPDARSRALRLAGCWLSLLSGGLGLMWTLLDEENLGWHDHMSKTFPTFLEPETAIGRRGKR